ncbi:hypothetical protein GCM10017044_15300 [Kordiimonas sediminis]|uniref:Uncharacterized protein n=1 Tax=Kordiimonas sediminis TaxID=1735581 RepID=A0A919AS00_9PROT|nr:hypothetical protein GCM10017044_15300 [Kordiimonas sediminis]
MEAFLQDRGYSDFLALVSEVFKKLVLRCRGITSCLGEQLEKQECRCLAALRPGHPKKTVSDDK